MKIKPSSSIIKYTSLVKREFHMTLKSCLNQNYCSFGRKNLYKEYNLYGNRLLNNYQIRFFFGSKKQEEDVKEAKESKENEGKEGKESKESKEKEGNEKETNKEETISLSKYNHLKELYDDSENNLSRIRTKFDELRKAYLENQSDLERIRKRSELEVSQAKEYSITKFAKDLLDVYDNFERALDSIKNIKNEETQEKIKNFETFTEGVVMTKDSLNKILGIHGIKQYDPINEKFDPTKHDAVYQSESDKVQPGNISDVIQKGFTIGNRVLRPAKVGVVKKK
jgi:molecular chaperone GrpE